MGSFPAWGAYENRPMWIPGIADKPLEELTMSQVTIAGCNYYPEPIFAEYNTYSDDVQAGFYAAMGGNPRDFSDQLEANIDHIKANTANYRYYVPGGGEHCIMNLDRFYNTEVEGVPFQSWVSDLAEGLDVPDVHCVNCEE